MSKKPQSGTATNNSLNFLPLKVNMRVDSIKSFKEVNILDCFHGEGKLWKAVQKKSTAKINITGIDINDYNNGSILMDSLKFIQTNDLSQYDVIDIDSWGSCIKWLEVLFRKKYKGIVHCTYCNPISANPDAILSDHYYGFKSFDILKSPSIFAKELPSMIKKYLNDNGIKEIFGHLSQKNNYFWFVIS